MIACDNNVSIGAESANYLVDLNWSERLGAREPHRGINSNVLKVLSFTEAKRNIYYPTY